MGPFAKQILNYSYPPLLYQRGDGDDEDEEDEDEEEDDDAAVREILEGGEGQLPEFDYEEDREIQELLTQGNADQDLYRQIKKAVNDDGYINQMVEGNVFEGNDYGQEVYEEYGEEGAQQIIDGEDLDDEEFLQMMEQQDLRLRAGQQNSTIINSSQNTSLEDNFVMEQ